MKGLKVRLMERMPGAELIEHLGYEPDTEPSNQQSNRRNGTTRKTLMDSDGAVPIDGPRDRNGSFEPELIKKGQTRIDGMDDKIIGLYTAGLSTRDIRAHLEDVYGLKVLADFEAGWGRKHPSIAPGWRRAWQEVIPFFAFPPAVRKIIYTTNAIESLNRVIRKTTKTRGSFPTDDAATKLIYLAIRSFEKTGRAVREWVAARNQFAILYPERFNK